MRRLLDILLLDDSSSDNIPKIMVALVYVVAPASAFLLLLEWVQP